MISAISAPPLILLLLPCSIEGGHILYWRAPLQDIVDTVYWGADHTASFICVVPFAREETIVWSKYRTFCIFNMGPSTWVQSVECRPYGTDRGAEHTAPSICMGRGRQVKWGGLIAPCLLGRVKMTTTMVMMILLDMITSLI